LSDGSWSLKDRLLVDVAVDLTSSLAADSKTTVLTGHVSGEVDVDPKGHADLFGLTLDINTAQSPVITKATWHVDVSTTAVDLNLTADLAVATLGKHAACATSETDTLSGDAVVRVRGDHLALDASVAYTCMPAANQPVYVITGDTNDKMTVGGYALDGKLQVDLSGVKASTGLTWSGDVIGQAVSPKFGEVDVFVPIAEDKPLEIGYNRTTKHLELDLKLDLQKEGKCDDVKLAGHVRLLELHTIPDLNLPAQPMDVAMTGVSHCNGDWAVQGAMSQLSTYTYQAGALSFKLDGVIAIVNYTHATQTYGLKLQGLFAEAFTMTLSMHIAQDAVSNVRFTGDWSSSADQVATSLVETLTHASGGSKSTGALDHVSGPSEMVGSLRKISLGEVALEVRKVDQEVQLLAGATVEVFGVKAVEFVLVLQHTTSSTWQVAFYVELDLPSLIKALPSGLQKILTRIGLNKEVVSLSISNANFETVEMTDTFTISKLTNVRDGLTFGTEIDIQNPTVS
jgi:hypothetical protein